MRFVYSLVALACAAAVYAVEPPAIRSEPPAIVCGCADGEPCLCPFCECTVPVLASLPYDADHTCDRCGTFANVVERELPGGLHSHRCGNCGREWQHADPGAVQYVAAPVANPFAVGDCANGRCPPRVSGAAYSSSSVRSAVRSGDGWRPGKFLGRFLVRLRGARGGCCG